MNTTYKIEGLVKGVWQDDAVGGSVEDNTFNTYAEARDIIPGLAKSLECQHSELRIVER